MYSTGMRAHKATGSDWWAMLLGHQVSPMCNTAQINMTKWWPWHAAGSIRCTRTLSQWSTEKEQCSTRTLAPCQRLIAALWSKEGYKHELNTTEKSLILTNSTRTETEAAHPHQLMSRSHSRFTCCLYSLSTERSCIVSPCAWKPHQFSSFIHCQDSKIPFPSGYKLGTSLVHPMQSAALLGTLLFFGRGAERAPLFCRSSWVAEVCVLKQSRLIRVPVAPVFFPRPTIFFTLKCPLSSILPIFS